MKRDELAPPKIVRESEMLFLATAKRAIDERFHIVAMDNLRVRSITTAYDELMKGWIEKGYGNVIHEGDAFGNRTLWSFSDIGLIEAQRVIRRERNRSAKTWMKRNALALIGVLAAVIAGAATTVSAYIDFVEMSDAPSQ